MPQIPPIDDAYIDDIIKSAGPYNEAITKTQGTRLRELMKRFRDYFEQEIAASATGDNFILASPITPQQKDINLLGGVIKTGYDANSYSTLQGIGFDLVNPSGNVSIFPGNLSMSGNGRSVTLNPSVLTMGEGANHSTFNSGVVTGTVGDNFFALTDHILDTRKDGVRRRIIHDPTALSPSDITNYFPNREGVLATLDDVEALGVNAYNVEQTYAMDELVYITDQAGNRLLYQSTANNNQGTYGGTGQIPNTEIGPIAPVNLETGIIFPYPPYGYTYDGNLEIKIIWYSPLLSPGDEPPVVLNVKLKNDDGRVVGLYGDFSFGEPITASGNFITVVFKIGEEPANNTEVIIDKAFLSIYTEIYYAGTNGITVKVTPDAELETQVIDLTTVGPSLWKFIGYPKPKPLDLSKFLTTSGSFEVKTGGLQIEDEFSSKLVRKLYEVNPYSQRDTINGYLEERVGQISYEHLQNVLNMYVVLGYFYSEGYFQNSFEITLISYDGATGKTYNVLQSYDANYNNYKGADNTTGWFELVPQTDGGSRGTNNIVLEAKSIYPYGWFVRAKVKSIDEGQDPSVGKNFGYYIKSVQGTFRMYYDTQNVDGIGPKTGIDEVSVTKTYGPTQIAQVLKIAGEPIVATENYALLTRDKTTGEIKQIDALAPGAYIEANPTSPQNANININGSLKATIADGVNGHIDFSKSYTYNGSVYKHVFNLSENNEINLAVIKDSGEYTGFFKNFATQSFHYIDEINQKGLLYYADYSANFEARSLVDKGYVDSAFMQKNGNVQRTGRIQVNGEYLISYDEETGDNTALKPDRIELNSTKGTDGFQGLKLFNSNAMGNTPIYFQSGNNSALIQLTSENYYPGVNNELQISNFSSGTDAKIVMRTNGTGMLSVGKDGDIKINQPATATSGFSILLRDDTSGEIKQITPADLKTLLASI